MAANSPGSNGIKSLSIRRSSSNEDPSAMCDTPNSQPSSLSIKESDFGGKLILEDTTYRSLNTGR